jgi:hypothetical protein
MQRAGGEAVFLERAEQRGDVDLAVAKDDGVGDVVLAAQKLAQRLALGEVFLLRGDHFLLDRQRGGGSFRHLDAYRVLQELLGEAGDLRRHGGREEQRLAGERDHLADPLDVRDEAHVEHAVSLVDHQDLDAGHQELAALDMVEQAAGRRDQHVGAAVDDFVLLAEGHAADQEGDTDLLVLAVFGEGFRHLGGEFARRLDDERARHAGAGATLFEARQHWQDEGGSLARAGLGDAQHVSAFQRMRNGLGLDRGRLGIAGGLNGSENFGAKAEFGK